jgi:hypothetical protein
MHDLAIIVLAVCVFGALSFVAWLAFKTTSGGRN